MSRLGQMHAMPVEFFTPTHRIAGVIETRHIHVRDVLNDRQYSFVIVHQADILPLHDLRGESFHARALRLAKDQLCFAIPRRVRGTTGLLAQQEIHIRLGKDEYRVWLSIPPFQIEGTLYVARSFDIRDVLLRGDESSFISLTQVRVEGLGLESVAFWSEEIVVRREGVAIIGVEVERESPPSP